MHGQGNYTTQVGQAPYTPQSAFQHRPVVAAPHPPPLAHHGPLPPQPQVIQQGHPSFHFRPGIPAYPHTIPSVPLQGPPVPGASSGMSSNQSYVTCHQPLQGNASTQMSYTYANSEQQRPPWSQNAHQFPPAASLPASSAYPLVSSQEHSLERVPPNQPTFHTPPPPQPPNTSSSSDFVRPDPYGPPVPPMRQFSYSQSMGTLPPPPPPPPLPSSSPPVVPPLPPSSPPSVILSKNDGSCSLNGESQNGNNLILECSPPGKPVEDRSLLQVEGLCLQAEKVDPKVELRHAIVIHSPGDSDMDMEDDITLPDVEKKNSLPNNSNDETIPTSQDDHMKEQLQDVQDAGTHIRPKVVLGGSAVPAGSKDPSGDNESSRERNGQTEQPLDDSSFHHENFGKPSVPVVDVETGYGALSGQLNEGTDPFNLLQDYASDDISDNEGENLLGDVSSQSIKDGSANFDTGKGCNFGLEYRMESGSESNKHMLFKSMNESANVMEADKISVGTGKVEKFSGKTSGGQEFDRHQPKDSSRNYEAATGYEDANMNQSDIKINATRLNLDEFGRLIREGVSDSDSSDSPRYTRRQGKRARKRSRSQSRSQSPHDRRRRRSPRRKERRGRSRSWSPKRSGSTSPVARRDIEFNGDKLRREKGQLPVCFAFLRGKCYRGTTCRYSHHEPDKSERKRYSRGSQLYRDKPPTLRSPDFHEESNSLPEKELKHKGLRPPLDMSGLKKVNDLEELPVISTTDTCEKDEKDSSLRVADVVARNLSGFSARDATSGKEDFVVPISLVSGKIHQIISQQDQQNNDSLFSEISVKEASVATSTHVPADKPHVKDDLTSQMGSLGNPILKPYFTEKVPSQPLKELSPPSGSHPSQAALPLPSVSQVGTVPFTQPLMQDYNMLPSAHYHLTSESYSPYRAPVSYQHFHFPGPSNTFVVPPLPLPLPPPPPRPSQSYFSTNITTGEHSFPSQNKKDSLLPSHEGLSSNKCKGDQPTEYPNQSWTGQFQAYSTAGEPGKGSHITDNFESSLTSQLGGPHRRGEHRLNGLPFQGVNLSQSFPQAQPNSLSIQSPSKGMQISVKGNPLSDSTRPYFQQALHGHQCSVATAVSAQFTETGKMSSSISNIPPDFPERNQSYVREIVGSRISNHFNPYASTFDLPLASNFNSNALTQENELNSNGRYGASFALSSASGDGHKIGGANLLPLSCGLPAENAIPRLGGDQYDPLFDSMEPASNSFTRVDYQRHETVGDSDDVLRPGGSGRILDSEGIKQEGGIAVPTSYSFENEEFGETADAEVGAVLNGSPSDPNDATDMNAGEVEIDQVKTSGKKKKSRERSMKLFKISIAAFVKEVLKPSWRQGNMSKEAFKTIVKKTVDKVSGAMKSHRIPRSQTRINQYIDSSRGKLTKLVMGYVDKYVKV